MKTSPQNLSYLHDTTRNTRLTTNPITEIDIMFANIYYPKDQRDMGVIEGGTHPEITQVTGYLFEISQLQRKANVIRNHRN